MKKFIKLNSISDLRKFVNAATLVEGDVICERGRYAIDGKSIMGLMSIDITDGFTVHYPEDADVFESVISKFE